MLTLRVAASKTFLLHAVVVIPASVFVHLHTVLGRVPWVKRWIGLIGSPVEEAYRGLICPGPANCRFKRKVDSFYWIKPWYNSPVKATSLSLFLSICKLTVVIPGKANPEVHIFAVVEALEEFYLCSAVNGDQLHPACLAVVFRVRPREADITTVHIVTVLPIGYRKALTHPITRGGSGWRFLWDTSVIIKGYINESIYN